MCGEEEGTQAPYETYKTSELRRALYWCNWHPPHIHIHWNLGIGLYLEIGSLQMELQISK